MINVWNIILNTITQTTTQKSKLQQSQTINIAMITFWSQFAAYSLNTILILFLTNSLLEHGLGYTQNQAYAFMGVSQATGYLMPILGGYMADQILGLRRSILLGSILLALAYLFIMLSGMTVTRYGDTLFLMAYAMTPAVGSLLMGTTSAMVSHIYQDEEVKAKSAMTYYYMAINFGALLATLIAPSLLESRYGPLSVLALTFVGKAIAALNFSVKFSLYDTVVWGKDLQALSNRSIFQVIAYILGIYSFTLFAFSHVHIAMVLLSLGCAIGIIWFCGKTWALSGITRLKQGIAILLIFEAIIFFVIYNQMNTTLILFAKHNVHNQLFDITFSPAHYQLLNPLLIIILGLYLPLFYKIFPRFSIPFQFACGTILASFALLLLALAPAEEGMIAAGYIASTYILITLAELWVSAIGLSMIGLYCDKQMLGFAMGAWYLASSLSNLCSGHIARWVALPTHKISKLLSLDIYQIYYWHLGLVVLGLGCVMLLNAYGLRSFSQKKCLNIA
ncbi:MAG: peptide MFS transporter [Gammaproteobacteria bacterium]